MDTAATRPPACRSLRTSDRRLSAGGASPSSRKNVRTWRPSVSRRWLHCLRSRCRSAQPVHVLPAPAPDGLEPVDVSDRHGRGACVVRGVNPYAVYDAFSSPEGNWFGCPRVQKCPVRHRFARLFDLTYGTGQNRRSGPAAGGGGVADRGRRGGQGRAARRALDAGPPGGRLAGVISDRVPRARAPRVRLAA